MRNEQKVSKAAKERIILLGASVRAMAASALRAGLTPYAIDLFADRDLRAVCTAVKIEQYPAGFLQALTTAPQGRPWMYTGGLENYPRIVEEMARIRPLLGNGAEVLQTVRNPRRLAATVREAGLAFPETTHGPVGASGRPDTSVHSWLLKPLRSSGGRSIRFATANDLARPPRGSYLQKFVEGQSASAVFVAAEGLAQLLGVSRQLIGSDSGLNRPFTYVGSIAPLPLGDEEASKLRQLGDMLAARFNLVGLFNVDFVRSSGELWVLEINPRYSASVEVLERVSACEFVGLHVAACREGIIPASLPVAGEEFAGKAVVYTRTDVVVAPEFDQLVKDWNLPAERPGIADLPRIGDRIRAGEPVATVFAEGLSSAAVEGRLRGRLAEVERVLSTEY